VDALKDLIVERRVEMLGSIRQELLSGIVLREHFDKLKLYLRAFPNLILDHEDYELAADFYNGCRNKGIQGSNTDFLICAVASRRNMAIFTNDKGFNLFLKVVPIQLFQI
jgi:predicted nucleic acid-binding protein